MPQRIDTENYLRLALKKQSTEERMYAVIRELMTPLSRYDDILSDEMIELFNKTVDLDIPKADYPEYGVYEKVNKKIACLTACSVLDEITPGKRKVGDFLQPTPTDIVTGAIACFKNATFDKAYKALSKHLSYHRIAYYSDFNSVCEAVYDGKADYCVLPVENSTDGRLGGFYNLITKYELFVCLATEILSDDENVKTRFALCGKKTEPLIPHKRETERYAELYVRPGEENTVSDILFYIDFFGIKTVKVDCVPSVYSDGEYDVHVTVISKETELVRLFLFFFLKQIRYSVFGIYTHA